VYVEGEGADWAKEYIPQAAEEQGVGDLHVTEKSTVNTMKLKGFLEDLLGLRGGVPRIAQDEVPACLHFYTEPDVILQR